MKTRRLSEINQSCNFSVVEPFCFEEASKQDIWVKAMKDEMNMTEINNNWDLVDKPKGREIVGVKWICKTKFNQDGSLQKHKARFVAKGFTQKPDIDFFETFAPVPRLETIRILIALATQKRWQIFQLDVKSAFFDGKLNEEIYVQQPQGFLVKGGEDKVYKLKNDLYGLKQPPPPAWFSEIDSYFISKGFQRSQSESTLYVKKKDELILIVCVYVDDLILT